MGVLILGYYIATIVINSAKVEKEDITQLFCNADPANLKMWKNGATVADSPESTRTRYPGGKHQKND